jgi:hypothetical protein
MMQADDRAMQTIAAQEQQTLPREGVQAVRRPGLTEAEIQAAPDRLLRLTAQYTSSLTKCS